MTQLDQYGDEHVARILAEASAGSAPIQDTRVDDILVTPAADALDLSKQREEAHSRTVKLLAEANPNRRWRAAGDPATDPKILHELATNPALADDKVVDQVAKNPSILAKTITILLAHPRIDPCLHMMENEGLNETQRTTLMQTITWRLQEVYAHERVKLLGDTRLDPELIHQIAIIDTKPGEHRSHISGLNGEKEAIAKHPNLRSDTVKHILANWGDDFYGKIFCNFRVELDREDLDRSIEVIVQKMTEEAREGGDFTAVWNFARALPMNPNVDATDIASIFERIRFVLSKSEPATKYFIEGIIGRKSLDKSVKNRLLRPVVILILRSDELRAREEIAELLETAEFEILGRMIRESDKFVTTAQINEDASAGLKLLKDPVSGSELDDLTPIT